MGNTSSRKERQPGTDKKVFQNISDDETDYTMETGLFQDESDDDIEKYTKNVTVEATPEVFYETSTWSTTFQNIAVGNFLLVDFMSSHRKKPTTDMSVEYKRLTITNERLLYKVIPNGTICAPNFLPFQGTYCYEINPYAAPVRCLWPSKPFWFIRRI